MCKQIYLFSGSFLLQVFCVIVTLYSIHSRLGNENAKRYFVATQDKGLRRSLRKLPGNNVSNDQEFFIRI